MESKYKTAVEIELAKGVSIERYERWVDEQAKDNIAKLIRNRFLERYLLPVGNSNRKHGFAMMAVACLVIETLVSFERGWADTRNKKHKPFGHFFRAYERFAPLAPIADRFYLDIRCGLLHQAESKGGWRIVRVGPLYDADRKAINATRFLKALVAAVEIYCEKLRNEEWEGPLWTNCRKKMAAICGNAAGRVAKS